MMAKMVISQDTLQQLLQQAKAVGNEQLVAQLEQAIANAKTLKNPNHIEDWEDATEAYSKGLLTIRKESIRKAAELLYQIANANPNNTKLQAEVLKLFSRAVRNSES